MYGLQSEKTLRAVARRMGIDFEEYMEHRKVGESRCVGPCKRWFGGKASGFECNECKAVRVKRRAAEDAANPKPKASTPSLKPVAFIHDDKERADEPQPPTANAWKRRDFVPTAAPPGPAKVDLLAARYDAGLPLWHPLDASNGPSEAELMGNNDEPEYDDLY